VQSAIMESVVCHEKDMPCTSGNVPRILQYVQILRHHFIEHPLNAWLQTDALENRIFQDVLGTE
jgi:hypothetical protein